MLRLEAAENEVFRRTKLLRMKFFAVRSLEVGLRFLVHVVPFSRLLEIAKFGHSLAAHRG
jgi:hypothetical protein